MKETKEIKNMLPIQYQLSSTYEKIDAATLYPTLQNGHLSVKLLFVAQFNAVPNVIIMDKIKIENANSWVLKNFAGEIKDCYYTKRELDYKKGLQYDDMIYFLDDDLIIYFDNRCSIVTLLFRKTTVKKVDDIIFGIQKFKQRFDRPEIVLLVNDNDSIGKKYLTISKPKLSLNDNYNADFKEVHDIILKRLQKEK